MSACDDKATHVRDDDAPLGALCSKQAYSMCMLVSYALAIATCTERAVKSVCPALQRSVQQPLVRATVSAKHSPRSLCRSPHATLPVRTVALAAEQLCASVGHILIKMVLHSQVRPQHAEIWMHMQSPAAQVLRCVLS
jgi:hypothetical protein